MLPQFLLDILTPVYQTLGFCADFGVITTQSDKLLANWAPTRRLPLTLSDMGHDSLHLLTGRRSTVGIATLASMNQTLNTTLDSSESVRVAIFVCGSGGCIAVEPEAQFVHPMGMAFALKASCTEIEVFANGAMVASFHTFGAGVAGVDKLVGVGRVQLVQESLGGKFSTSQTGEF